MSLLGVWVAPALTILATLAALAACWWAHRLVAGTPLADLGLAVNLAAVLAVLGVVDWLLERFGQRH
ncbi:MAG TPA: hypothetical protein VHL31_13185 [Geminicoccus sp.]|uniref:hypothetical protein n=1 Tax=Geminicoccus sp. TaxID=2024832 RepID=UPI002E2EAB57|nr:hypothetical protein [Geminicoccus sp.]HEX2527235.1 hypothetical protein [Geminicoccus sp.]